ncbi:hypothetical protein BN2476_530036 [Paraburkholderia piptadeniae]|uniref:Uncharacterized protein n=1 Tax=Paraburkholderia piptadeniae TaxID=1701573 RepID=A0A1N7SHK4_9BURK|nr:hypothetical protein BN2476_530036 [Paraburkholderia piptadeniae]
MASNLYNGRAQIELNPGLPQYRMWRMQIVAVCIDVTCSTMAALTRTRGPPCRSKSGRRRGPTPR